MEVLVDLGSNLSHVARSKVLSMALVVYEDTEAELVQVIAIGVVSVTASHWQTVWPQPLATPVNIRITSE